MNKRFKFSLIVLLFLPVWVSAQSTEEKLQAVIDSFYIVNPASVGIMVHVESPDRQLSWSGAVGYSEKKTKSLLEADQPALIASNIKTYVSATILRLVEDDKLFIHQPIKKFLTDKTRKLFEQGGYNLDSIRIEHLLSHTSGIQNYANQAYIDFINNNKKYRWTRDEQLELTIKVGSPLGEPGTIFNYSDANYLLLTEIIEDVVKKPFFTAMREILQYESLGLNDTWMPTLEEMPTGTKPLVHQYWSEYNVDSYEIDVSVDLYGGGGIACTTEDLANFIYKLFNSEIIKDTNVFNLIYTEIPTNSTKASNYYLGIYLYNYQGLNAYGHGGFWGTSVLYFPELKTSIAVFILERDKRKLKDEIINQFITLMN